MKATAAKNEADRRKLKEALDISEQRATKLELARRALEGDLQRSKLTLNDKETANQVRHCRFCEGIRYSILMSFFQKKSKHPF